MSEPLVEEGDQKFVLYGIGWDQYVTINDAFPDGRGPRFIYIDRCLTFLSLSPRHKWSAYHLDAIIKAVAPGCQIKLEIAGSATFRLETEKVGIEGDLTYYFGPNAEVMSGPIDIDLSTQPPPDLAIEVEDPHPADNSIATYARIGVPEVWRYHARRRTLAFLVLGENGSYNPAPRSRNFPGLTPEDVFEQLRLADEVRDFSQWYAQLTEKVPLTLLPRADGG